MWTPVAQDTKIWLDSQGAFAMTRCRWLLAVAATLALAACQSTARPDLSLPAYAAGATYRGQWPVGGWGAGNTDAGTEFAILVFEQRRAGSTAPPTWILKRTTTSRDSAPTVGWASSKHCRAAPEVVSSLKDVALLGRGRDTIGEWAAAAWAIVGDGSERRVAEAWGMDGEIADFVEAADRQLHDCWRRGVP